MKRRIALAGLTLLTGVGIYQTARALARPVNLEIEPIATLQIGNEYNVIDFHKVANFTASEFGGALEHVDEKIVYAVDELRRRLGVPVMISPARGSIARFDDGSKTSQHYAVGRKSTAMDIMAPATTLREIYYAALAIPEIGGIGLYPDWNPHPGAHIDTRQRKANGAIHSWMGIDTYDAAGDETGQILVAINFNTITERLRARA